MEDKKTVTNRRSMLKGAAVAAGAMSAPMIATADTTTTLRFQSTWPAKDIFHEYANDFAKKVNDMTGGDLRIEVLPAGAVVPAFGLLDAVTKGTLDAKSATALAFGPKGVLFVGDSAGAAIYAIDTGDTKSSGDKPVNFLNSGAFGFSVDDLAKMGVRRISVGGSLSRVAMHAFIKMAKEISEQGTFTGFDGLITNAELNKFFSEDRKKRQ